MKTSLVIMAAGIGSRFGGIKQLEPMGPNGEIIMDYSVYEAVRAGFDRVVFIIRRDIEKEFRELIGDRISRNVETEYVFQRPDDLPAGFSVPEGRKKPWGTGQAVLSVKGHVDGPFAVVNADDYYGTECYRAVHDFLASGGERGEDGKLRMCMAGFILKNTLSENGSVARGVCSVSPDGMLTGVKETYGIRMENGKLRAEDGAGRAVPVSEDQLVSMNMWGLPAGFLDGLSGGFRNFLSGLGEDALKKEFLLPEEVDRAIREGRGTVRVLPTRDKWFGVTYREDTEAVREAFRKLTESGVYPEKLW